jgi:outer membrane protein assembly factor BamB
LAAATGKELWRFEAKDAITAAAAAAGKLVYVPANDGRLYALDTETGKEVWQFTIEDKISSGAVIMKNPRGPEMWVLFNGYDGTTRVLNAADGKLVV